MNIDLSMIRPWFDQHPNYRIVFKQATIGAIGFVLWGLTYFAFKVPAEYSSIYMLVLNILNDKFKLLSPFEPWPVIGKEDKNSKKEKS